MDVLRRYSNEILYEDSNGNQHPRRYSRVNKEFSSITIELEKQRTFDDLSLQYFGTPIMYWLIADYNDYLDPDVTLLKGTKIKIPVIG